MFYVGFSLPVFKHFMKEKKYNLYIYILLFKKLNYRPLYINVMLYSRNMSKFWIPEKSEFL